MSTFGGKADIWWGQFPTRKIDAVLKILSLFSRLKLFYRVLSASCCKYGQDLHFLRHFDQEFRITVEMMREVGIPTTVASHRLDA
jgi:hypothetical protein